MSILRLVLVAVIALVLPLQGAAAVATAQCMALGHHDTPSDPGHAHEGGHDDGHHGDGGLAKNPHCGPCVACCSSAAIAPTMKIVPSRSSAGYVVALPQPLRSGTPPDRLFRPPLQS